MRILNAETEPVNVVEDFLFEGITPESGVLNSLQAVVPCSPRDLPLESTAYIITLGYPQQLACKILVLRISCIEKSCQTGLHIYHLYCKIS